MGIVTAKRIELNKKLIGNRVRARLSRTGGPSLSLRIFKGLTYNTADGLRGSKTRKGLTVGFSRGGLFFRGRWKLGESLRLNLSKRSGFSLSWKNAIGAINLTRPQYSSAKLFGIQFRGRRAQSIQFYYLIFAAAIFLLQLIIAGIYALSLLFLLFARETLRGMLVIFNLSQLAGAAAVAGSEWLFLNAVRKLNKKARKNKASRKRLKKTKS